MTHHNHENPGWGGHTHGNHGRSGKAPIHKDWRVWLGVVLMVGAIAMYVLSMDESIQPTGGTRGGQGATTTAPAQR